MKNKDFKIASTFGILFDLTSRSFATHLTNAFNKKGIDLTAEQYKILVILYDLVWLVTHDLIGSFDCSVATFFILNKTILS